MTDPPAADEVANDEQELRRCAAALDAASAAASHYQLSLLLRAELGVPAQAEISGDLPAEVRATLLAYEYFVETNDDSGRRRITLVPRHFFGTDSQPSPVRDVDERTIEAWRALAGLVRRPAARARMHHLLFQRGGRDAADHARAAADAYIDSAADWARSMDAVNDLAAATRLARAVGDLARVTHSLELMANLAADQLEAEEPLAGIILRALTHLVGEQGCPARVDELLEQAANAWPDGHRRDQAYALMLQRCTDDACRATVWERRVQAHIDHADAEASPLMRGVRLQQALATAEASNIRDLRVRAASLLQAVRGRNRDMVRFTASSRRYEEQFDDLVDSLIVGDSWHAALVRFATFGPITGNVDTNRANIENDHKIAPFANLLPVELVTPEGLPFFSGSDEQTRFDVDLVSWEQQLIEQWVRPLSVALHEIPPRHALPPRQTLTAFLDSWPGAFGNGATLADVLNRYWAGDPNGAAFAIVPGIEALVRHLVLATDTGIYRLQRNQTPGQYPGLGVLLPLLAELYQLPESRSRFLAALLTHPAGLNLRNRMAHGYISGVGSPIAAVLIHAALGLAAIAPPNADADPPAEEQPGQ